MVAVLIRRLFAVWLAVTVTFFALRLTAYDALTAQLTDVGANPDLIEQRRQEYGLDQPLLLQYLNYLSQLGRGDLGMSLARQLPVSFILGEAMGSTFALAVPALILATLVGILIGITAAFRNIISWLARLWIGLSISTPPYWTGTLAIFIFSASLHWLPSSSADDVRHLILPVGVLTFHTSGGIARVVQSGIIQTQSADFIRTARAKGLPERLILFRHILRVGLLPVIAVIGLQTGFVLGGTVVTEILFLRPGLGRVLLDATLRRDYPVVQAVVLLSAILYTSLSMVTDFISRLLDPRIRYEAR
ncbi:MAG TPA: ABC transporter permease [Phototrophicaceae bacterium]|jgi:ABC-type dipeptide/oligopeptide/nickel transport system permease component|nr:ABC transporter permease [Phototrophicaceae bacterium]